MPPCRHTANPLFREKQKILYNVCRVPSVAHGKGLPCATHGKPCRQVVPCCLLPSVTFFCRVSSLTHGKASPCAHNLVMSIDKVHRGRVCCVFFVMSNTWQSLHRVLFGLCRVRQAHGETPPSGSDMYRIRHSVYIYI